MSADTLEMMFREFCLPTMAARFAEMMQSAEAQNWGYRKLLLQLCEAEAADRRERKRERLLRESGLPCGQDPGQPGGRPIAGQSAAAVTHAPGGGLHRAGREPAGLRAARAGQDPLPVCPGPGAGPAARLPVYFTPTFKLVQQLLTAKRELRLDKLLKKLDRFDAVILDDLGYVQQSREEMEVLFTFLAERYERRSVLLSSNLVFSKWDQIFKDPMTTMAAVDRLVHHAIILEFDGESMRVPRPKEKGGG